MVRQHRTTAVVVITLALAASFAPTAAADPAPLNRAEAAIAAAHSSIPARPNPDQQQTVGSPSRTPRLTEKQAKAIAAHQIQAGLHPGVFGPNPPRVSNAGTGAAHITASNRGFDWGDAGIGAGASLILLGIGLAGLRAATTSRTRRAREKRAMAAG